MRTTKNISITMPPSMAKEAEKLARKERRTISELLREALRRYMENQQWRQQWGMLRTYGKAKAKEMGIKASDVNRLTQEYRNEQRQKK